MISVHIRRNVSEGHRQALMSLINQMRSTIVGNSGYVSGETLKGVDPPGVILVVSKWQSHFYWKQWYDSEERLQIQDKIDQLIGIQTEYEIFEYE